MPSGPGARARQQVDGESRSFFGLGAPVAARRAGSQVINPTIEDSPTKTGGTGARSTAGHGLSH